MPRPGPRTRPGIRTGSGSRPQPRPRPRAELRPRPGLKPIPGFRPELRQAGKTASSFFIAQRVSRGRDSFCPCGSQRPVFGYWFCHYLLKQGNPGTKQKARMTVNYKELISIHHHISISLGIYDVLQPWMWISVRKVKQ